MGFYINVPDMSKEDWLEKNGVEVDPAPEVHMDEQNRVAVCLVDNGWMTAAGIAYDRKELDAFKMPDGRPKTWYLVGASLLEPFMQGKEIVR